MAALYDGDELYDPTEDPYELRNLVDDPGHLASRTHWNRYSDVNNAER